VIELGSRPQRTLARRTSVTGTAFLTGLPACVVFEPAPEDTGIVFERADLPGRPRIPAHVAHVVSTDRCTALGHGPAQVMLVEHILAALAGLHLDNCVVVLHGPEPPGLDGSAYGFVQALQAGGVVLQKAMRPIWGVVEPIVLSEDGRSLAFYPDRERLRITYYLDYGAFRPPGQHRHTLVCTPEHFVREVARSRTFLLAEEVQPLRQRGWGTSLTAADVVVFDRRGVVANRLRWADEPARHKILDLVGDLALAGLELRGHVVGCRSGHRLNVALARRLREALPSARPSAAAVPLPAAA